MWRDFAPEVEVERGVDQELVELLESLSPVANMFSLVLKFFHGEPLDLGSIVVALILGDATSDVLDSDLLSKYDMPRRRRVAFARAAHHGTHYGGYVDRLCGAVLWTSWTESLLRAWDVRAHGLNSVQRNVLRYLAHDGFAVRYVAETTYKLRISVNIGRAVRVCATGYRRTKHGGYEYIHILDLDSGGWWALELLKT